MRNLGILGSVIAFAGLASAAAQQQIAPPPPPEPKHRPNRTIDPRTGVSRGTGTGAMRALQRENRQRAFLKELYAKHGRTYR